MSVNFLEVARSFIGLKGSHGWYSKKVLIVLGQVKIMQFYVNFRMSQFVFKLEYPDYVDISYILNPPRFNQDSYEIIIFQKSEIQLWI